MTENEAIKILIEDSCYECAQGTDSPVNCQYAECILAEATREGVRALKEVQQYRELIDRLKAIYGDQMTLKDMVDVMERIIRKPGRRILSMPESLHTMKRPCGMNTGKSVHQKN